MSSRQARRTGGVNAEGGSGDAKQVRDPACGDRGPGPGPAMGRRLRIGSERSMRPIRSTQPKIDSGSRSTDGVQGSSAVLDRFPDQVEDQALNRIERFGFCARQTIMIERKPGEDPIFDEPEARGKAQTFVKSGSRFWGRLKWFFSAIESTSELINRADRTGESTGDSDDGVGGTNLHSAAPNRMDAPIVGGVSLSGSQMS